MATRRDIVAAKPVHLVRGAQPSMTTLGTTADITRRAAPVNRHRQQEDCVLASGRRFSVVRTDTLVEQEWDAMRRQLDVVNEITYPVDSSPGDHAKDGHEIVSRLEPCAEESTAMLVPLHRTVSQSMASLFSVAPPTGIVTAGELFNILNHGIVAP